MAKVTFMDGIASVSGKLGDIIYRKTLSGNYSSKHPPPNISLCVSLYSNSYPPQSLVPSLNADG